jgi:hypothetical protein
MEKLVRYAVILEKNPREIVLLRGTGCKWKKCMFCDYHLDASSNVQENFALNRDALSRVDGRFGQLEVINSGSFPELDEQTVDEVLRVCQARHIRMLHMECHWQQRQEIPAIRARFAKIGVQVKVKLGVETFDRGLREHVLHKGLDETDPVAMAAAGFNECCLLFGLHGQNAMTMRNDIETGLRYFERVCINIFVENSTRVKPDPEVIATFRRELFPAYQNDPRVDILYNNEDFGVGAKENIENT